MSAVAMSAQRAVSPWRAMVGAELLKLRRRRGLLVASFLLSVGPMLIAYAVLVLMHASDPSEHSPAGGVENFADSVQVLSLLLVVVALLAGVTAGAADVRAGVFRELAVTGRSRLALFAVRIPGGLAFLVAPVGLALALPVTASVALAGSGEAPSASLLIETVAWMALVVAANFCVALGVGSLVGSATTSIAVLLGWNFAVMPVLRLIEPLGDARAALLPVALERLQPAALGDGPANVSVAAAALSVACWLLLPLALGAWRTCTRDA